MTEIGSMGAALWQTATSRMQNAAENVVAGDIEAGAIGMTEAKVEASAATALIKSGDEQMEMLTDLLLGMR